MDTNVNATENVDALLPFDIYICECHKEDAGPHMQKVPCKDGAYVDSETAQKYYDLSVNRALENDLLRDKLRNVESLAEKLESECGLTLSGEPNIIAIAFAQEIRKAIA